MLARRLKRQFGLAVLGIVMVAGSGCALSGNHGDPEPREASIGATANYRLTSDHVDQVFSIDVWMPMGMPGPHPVVYVLDGNGVFGMAAQTVGPLIFGGGLPPMIVVGIGYEVTNPMDVVTLRTRDLLPTYVEGFAERMAAQGLPLPEGVRPGGADDFLSFIEDELKPFIESRYEIDSEDQTLIGDSFGGTFATHVLISSTDSFDRYVIGSPALGWDEGKLFVDAEAHARSGKTLPVNLFLSAGELEIENGILAETERMIEFLEEADYEGLEMKTHIFPGETHYSVIGATISRGLRAVFGTWPVER